MDRSNRVRPEIIDTVARYLNHPGIRLTNFYRIIREMLFVFLILLLHFHFAAIFFHTERARIDRYIYFYHLFILWMNEEIQHFLLPLLVSEYLYSFIKK